MALLHQLLIFLHVVTGAAWLGLSLRLGNQARLAAAGESAVLAEGGHAVRLMNLMVLLTFIFSMGALLLGRGYPGQMQYHVASLLIVFLVVVQYALIRPAWGRLGSGTEEEKGRVARRVAMFAGIGHLIWLVLLVLMFWNRFVAVL